MLLRDVNNLLDLLKEDSITNEVLTKNDNFWVIGYKFNGRIIIAFLVISAHNLLKLEEEKKKILSSYSNIFV